MDSVSSALKDDIWKHVHRQFPTLPEAAKSMRIPLGRSIKKAFLCYLFDHDLASEQDILIWDNADCLLEPEYELTNICMGTSRYARLPCRGLPCSYASVKIDQMFTSPSAVARGFQGRSIFVGRLEFDQDHPEDTVTAIANMLRYFSRPGDALLHSTHSHSYAQVQTVIEYGSCRLFPFSTSETEFGDGIYFTDDIPTALGYATFRVPGPIYVYSKQAASEARSGVVKYLIGKEWEEIVKRGLTTGGSRYRPFERQDISLVAGPISRNHTEIQMYRQKPQPSEVMQYVWPYHCGGREFESHPLDKALLGIIYII